MDDWSHSNWRPPTLGPDLVGGRGGGWVPCPAPVGGAVGVLVGGGYPAAPPWSEAFYIAEYTYFLRVVVIYLTPTLRK